MDTTRTSSSPTDDIVDSTPLLGNSTRDDDRSRRFGRSSSLRGAARFLRRASSRRMMREPSMLVRENAAEQLEERQSDWAYSRPVVVLDIIWNLAFVIIAIVFLILSRNEHPAMPLRLWILGYALQCILHMVFVCMEYRRRHPPQQRSGMSVNAGNGSSGNLSSSSQEESSDSREYLVEPQQDGGTSNSSVAKHLESANTMFSFIWWIIGFYWVSAGGQTLTTDAPQLYWLCIVFLAFDVFFVVFCVALACVIGIAVCCCLPCIIAILYAVADQQEGASKDDIEQLPKYKFRKIGDSEKLNGELQGPFGGIMTECNTDAPAEHVLPLEDADIIVFSQTEVSNRRGRILIHPYSYSPFTEACGTHMEMIQGLTRNAASVFLPMMMEPSCVSFLVDTISTVPA
ncbi:hypothetical protein BVC80_1787g224 [Macleaya cordata]|uniref:RING-type E3 ubiquitin transferase n=1 Tax=Macleaya cordata TaxID=56857 RepID=A0A200QUM1_MACCD|nr:hypothetical protein BVC80_1787g224 [Macleaya cordata]